MFHLGARWQSRPTRYHNVEGRTIWIVDAHRGDGRRFVVRADEKLSAFGELESAGRARESMRSYK